MTALGAPTRTRVKICGITRVADAIAAAQLGVDAIGLMFYPHSSRVVDIATANTIIQHLPPFITTVGVFLNTEQAQVAQILDQVALDLLQFHGDESADFCAAFQRPFIKAVPMRERADVKAYAQRFKAAQALLLDSHGDGVIGGSGQRFDWDLIPSDSDLPIILAGGLNVHNVAAAITQTQPYAIDVSSGVESAKGIKNYDLMQQFMQQVSTCNAYNTNTSTASEAHAEPI